MPKPQLRREKQATAVLEKPAVSNRADEKLVRECIAGKEEAWVALLEKYKNLIFSIPLKQGLSREDAAEIFQAVCAELLSELPKLRDPQALSGWLIKVTTHKCFHAQRQAQRFNTAEEAPDAGTQAETLAENLLIEVEQEQKLREAIANLSPRCRELVHILFYEDPPRPYKEVAESLGIAVGSIGFIRGRCLEKLRVSLERLEFK
jgi:RNA polymerase sigma factor (sigma-70 family)